MAAIAIPTLAWLFVIPLKGAYDQALRDHLEAADRNGRVRAITEAARTSPARRSTPSSADLALVITESAAQSGIPLESTVPAGANALTVQVASAPATVLRQWLRDLSARGIVVEELRMTPNADQSVALSARLVRR